MSTIPQSAIDDWVTKPEAVYFAKRDREWVRRKWDLIRDAMIKADTAVNEWRQLSAEVMAYLDDSGITDIVQRTKIKGENLTLADHLSTSTWYRKEAEVHMADVNLFLRLKEMGLL